MPGNPFIKREDWRKDKVTYGIPDAVIKVSFGEEMQKLYDKYEKAGLKGPMTLKKVPAARELIKAGNKLIDDFLVGLKSDKIAKKVKNKDGAVKRLELYKSWLDGLERACLGAVDVFAGPRHNYPLCVTLLSEAKKDPSDAKALQDLYSQGMRNHLGAVFHAALTTYKGGVPRVTELLKDYEEALKEWHSSMQGAGPSTIAKNPVKRKEFVEDMEKPLKMGKEILDLTV